MDNSRVVMWEKIVKIPCNINKTWRKFQGARFLVRYYLSGIMQGCKQNTKGPIHFYFKKIRILRRKKEVFQQFLRRI